MTDSEMLILSAKAADIGEVLCYEAARNCLRIGNRTKYKLWRPLNNDGDAHRLAVKLRMVIHHTPTYVVTISYDTIHASHEEGTSTEATCRAIVRTAAEIGKKLK